MQPDGALNVSADPPELPDPSDSDARTGWPAPLWALGEGYRAFRASIRRSPLPAERLDLALGALDRRC